MKWQSSENHPLTDDNDAAHKFTQQIRTFAEHFAVHGEAVAAYREAYPLSRRWKMKCVSDAASRLLEHPGVAATVKDIREPVIKKLGYDLKWILTEAVRQYNGAMLRGNARAAASCLELISELAADRPGCRYGESPWYQ
jgi:hypothetical protein